MSQSVLLQEWKRECLAARDNRGEKIIFMNYVPMKTVAFKFFARPEYILANELWGLLVRKHLRIASHPEQKPSQDTMPCMFVKSTGTSGSLFERCDDFREGRKSKRPKFSTSGHTGWSWSIWRNCRNTETWSRIPYMLASEKNTTMNGRMHTKSGSNDSGCAFGTPWRRPLPQLGNDCLSLLVSG